jgi:L-lactate dehydrogenase complex protein LldF
VRGRAARWNLRLLPRWLIYNRFNPWGLQRELPAPPTKSFREQYRQQNNLK